MSRPRQNVEREPNGRKQRARAKERDDPWGALHGDQGPNTEAARLGLSVERVEGDANNTFRAFREGALERLHKKDGGLSLRQFQAGVEIRAAFESTQKSPPAIRGEFVDSAPDPDAVITMQVDKISRLKRAMKAVPGDMVYVVRHVCFDNASIGALGGGGKGWGMHAARLQVALDLVANELGY